MKLYTFPNAINDARITLFNSNVSTLGRNSDGGTGDSTPQTNKYQVEKGSDYIYTSGSPQSSGGMRMGFNTSIGNHYWMCCISGSNKHSDPKTSSYSPLYDSIFTGVKFDWNKKDNGTSSKHKFRLYKMGVVYRSSDSGMSLKDFPRDGNQNLFNFGSVGTTNGSCTLALDSAVSHVMGIYFQLETEGNGGLTTGGSYIDIKNLKYVSKYSSKEALLSPKKTYSSKNPPSGKRELWTY